MGHENLPSKKRSAPDGDNPTNTKRLTMNSYRRAWTNVTLTLKGVSPNNLKYLKIGINMENVIFDSIHPLMIRKEAKKIL